LVESSSAGVLGVLFEAIGARIVHNRQLLQAYSSMAVGEFTFLKHC
jgi:hypothetical protein